MTPVSICIPNRRPFVRDTAHIDTIGPPPDGPGFDQTQDALIALYQAAAGGTWAIGSDDLLSPLNVASTIGDMRITINVPGGLTAAVLAANEAGVHGAWQFTSGVTPYTWEMQSGDCWLGGDWLWTARVTLLGLAELDPVAAPNPGFRLGLSARNVGLPAFHAGGDSPNWHIYYKPTRFTESVIDTGIAVATNRWHLLQISRDRGGVRWHINGMPVRVPDATQPAGNEGAYLPDEMAGARKYLYIKRWGNGAANNGFRLDYFHIMAQR